MTNQATLPLFFYGRYSFLHWPNVTLLPVSHDRSNWSHPSFYSTTLQNLPSISDLISEVYNFQRHSVLCSKCSTLLVSSLNLSQFCWWKEPSCQMLLCHDHPGFSFTCTPCSICYHATQIVDKFHILQYGLSYSVPGTVALKFSLT